MSPIPRAAVQFTQRIRNPAVRNRTLNLIEIATMQSDLSHFTGAVLKNPSHTSHTDLKPHATVRLATNEQAARQVSQTVHIYHDEDGNYDGHQLFPERPDKKSDE
ncbi:hypothetical protein GGS24DRAFT_495373 [Hypoxylon argillaceum]|nr:hypothetical protein GGS24DRAFT_495373 [Hypoxylon argillaceum]KAI1144882.1 hypothetical protein F4825DRAFT_467779 [Nemania diffusa]